MTTQTTKDALVALHARLAEIGGCSNGGCHVVKRIGMVTNGPCHCLENRHTANRIISAYKQYVCEMESIKECRPMEAR